MMVGNIFWGAAGSIAKLVLSQTSMSKFKTGMAQQFVYQKVCSHLHIKLLEASVDQIFASIIRQRNGRESEQKLAFVPINDFFTFSYNIN